MALVNGWITPTKESEIKPGIKTLGLLIDLDHLYSDLKVKMRATERGVCAKIFRGEL